MATLRHTKAVTHERFNFVEGIFWLLIAGGCLFIPCEESDYENTSLWQRCSLLYLVFPFLLKSEAATGGSLGGFWPGRPDAWSVYCHIIIRITDTRAVQNNYFSECGLLVDT